MDCRDYELVDFTKRFLLVHTPNLQPYNGDVPQLKVRSELSCHCFTLLLASFRRKDEFNSFIVAAKAASNYCCSSVVIVQCLQTDSVAALSSCLARFWPAYIRYTDVIG